MNEDIVGHGLRGLGEREQQTKGNRMEKEVSNESE